MEEQTGDTTDVHITHSSSRPNALRSEVCFCGICALQRLEQSEVDTEQFGALGIYKMLAAWLVGP